MAKMECILCGGKLLETENGYKCDNCLRVFTTEAIEEKNLANKSVTEPVQNQKHGDSYFCMCCGALLERKDGNKYVCKWCNSTFAF